MQGEEALLVGFGSELRVNVNCGRELEGGGGVRGQRCWGERE